MWIDRDLSLTIPSKGDLPIQVVWGPRQSGKSSLLRRLSQNWAYVTLDEIANQRLAQEDPALFFERYRPPVVVDEAPYAPALFPQMKFAVDEARFKEASRDPLFRITGSHQLILDRSIKESLGGRASFYRLHPLSLHELQPLAPPVEEAVFVAAGQSSGTARSGAQRVSRRLLANGG